jgi:hypothetical protein
MRRGIDSATRRTSPFQLHSHPNIFGSSLLTLTPLLVRTHSLRFLPCLSVLTLSNPQNSNDPVGTNPLSISSVTKKNSSQIMSSWQLELLLSTSVSILSQGIEALLQRMLIDWALLSILLITQRRRAVPRAKVLDLPSPHATSLLSTGSRSLYRNKSPKYLRILMEFKSPLKCLLKYCSNKSNNLLLNNEQWKIYGKCEYEERKKSFTLCWWLLKWTDKNRNKLIFYQL